MSRRHEVRWMGPGVQPGSVPVPVFQELLELRVEGSRRALRLRVEGRGTAPAPLPAWMDAAARFEESREPSSAPGAFQIESHPVRAFLPEGYRASDVPLDFDLEGSALDLFEEGLAEALAGETTGDASDDGLLETCGALARLFEQGVESFTLRGVRALTVDREGVARALQVRRQTPSQQAFCLAGTLKAFRREDRAFILVPRSRTVLKGIAERLAPAEWAPLRGKPVVVEGWVSFRPDGSVLRLDAESLYEAAPRELALWSALPSPLFWTPPGVRGPGQTEEAPPGVGENPGSWPDDEPYEEFLAAIEEMS